MHPERKADVTGDPTKVFLIHGRNIPARNAMVHFLRTLKLDVLDFDALSAQCGGSEFIGTIIRKGMELGRGIIALFTPDEFAKLDQQFVGAHEEGPDKERWQARPNVLFEAGMAMGIDERRTILVTLGADVKLFSDVSGRHIVRLNNSPDSRRALIQRLTGVGCTVDQGGQWFDLALAGDFESCVRAPQPQPQSVADYVAGLGFNPRPSKKGEQ